MADVDFRTHVHGMSNIFLSEIKKITSEFLPKISPVKNPLYIICAPDMFANIKTPQKMELQLIVLKLKRTI